MSGLRYESLGDMPEGLRKLAAVAVADQVRKDVRMGATCASPAKENKYHNQVAERGRIKFDSQKEARRYDYLMYCLERGYIRDLHLQEEFTLQPAFTQPDGTRIRAIRYYADFSYTVVRCPLDPCLRITAEDQELWRSVGTGSRIIEDVKSRGTRTKVYIMKMKMMEAQGHHIREV